MLQLLEGLDNVIALEMVVKIVHVFDRILLNILEKASKVDVSQWWALIPMEKQISTAGETLNAMGLIGENK